VEIQPGNLGSCVFGVGSAIESRGSSSSLFGLPWGTRTGMGGQDPGRWAGTDRPGARGFTLIELLLVTVVLGILAMIVAPYFGRARERAYLAQMQADARHLMEGVETYLSLNDGSFPTSIADLEANSAFTHTTDVQYCLFTSVPRTGVRDPYVLAMAGHAGTTTKVFIAYPLWGSRIIDFDSGRRGC